jgi:rhodanese-related sulfurtransferase
MFRLISAEQMLAKMTSFLDATNGTPAIDKLYLLEIGTPQEFDVHHLPKGISAGESLNPAQVHHYISNQAAEVILYGKNGDDFPRLEEAAKCLFDLGYSFIYIYKEGKEDWISKNLWLESSVVPADHERKITQVPQMPKKPETGIQPPFSKVA